MRGSTVGKEISGSQYKHLYIGSNSITINDYQLPGVFEVCTAEIIDIIVKKMNKQTQNAVKIAEIIVGIANTKTLGKVEISESTYEIRFTYDDEYYIHCHHDVVKSYDNGGHLVDTTREYYQAIGG